MNADTNIEKLLQQNSKTESSTAADCNCLISNTEVEQAEADIEQERYHRELEARVYIEEERMKVATNVSLGRRLSEEAVYVDSYQPVGVTSEPALQKLELGEVNIDQSSTEQEMEQTEQTDQPESSEM